MHVARSIINNLAKEFLADKCIPGMLCVQKHHNPFDAYSQIIITTFNSLTVQARMFVTMYYLKRNVLFLSKIYWILTMIDAFVLQPLYSVIWSSAGLCHSDMSHVYLELADEVGIMS